VIDACLPASLQTVHHCSLPTHPSVLTDSLCQHFQWRSAVETCGGELLVNWNDDDVVTGAAVQLAVTSVYSGLTPATVSVRSV